MCIIIIRNYMLWTINKKKIVSRKSNSINGNKRKTTGITEVLVCFL